MTNFDENLETFTHLQQEGLEPARQFAASAVDAFEKFARRNYAVYGDILDLTVSHAQLAVKAKDPKELFESAIAGNKAFTELLNQHAKEYFELGRSVQEEFVAQQPVVKPSAATKKAA